MFHWKLILVPCGSLQHAGLLGCNPWSARKSAAMRRLVVGRVDITGAEPVVASVFRINEVYQGELALLQAVDPAAPRHSREPSTAAGSLESSMLMLMPMLQTSMLSTRAVDPTLAEHRPFSAVGPGWEIIGLPGGYECDITGPVAATSTARRSSRSPRWCRSAKYARASSGTDATKWRLPRLAGSPSVTANRAGGHLPYRLQRGRAPA